MLRNLGRLYQHNTTGLAVNTPLNTRKVSFYHEKGVYYLSEGDVTIENKGDYVTTTTAIFANRPYREVMGEGKFSQRKADELIASVIETNYKGWFK